MICYFDSDETIKNFFTENKTGIKSFLKTKGGGKEPRRRAKSFFKGYFLCQHGMNYNIFLCFII